MTTCTLAYDDAGAACLEDSQRFEKRRRPQRWSLNAPVKRALQLQRHSVSFSGRTSPTASGGFNRRNIKKSLYGMD